MPILSDATAPITLTPQTPLVLRTAAPTPIDMVSRQSASPRARAASASLPIPRYAETFRCIGSACEDSCCKAWDLRLDQATYDRYQLIPVESLLGRIVQSSVVPLPEPRSEHWYARIQLNASLECPFLTEEKWCGIQQALGEEALSHTCKTYPRIEQRTVTGKRETTLHLSCPEASRLVLLEEHAGSGVDILEPNTGRTSGQSVEAVYETLAPPGRRLHPSQAAYLGEIRRFLLVLLRDRRYSVGERLFLTGLFAGRLRLLQSAVKDSGDPASMAYHLPNLLRDYCLLAGQGTLRPALGQVASQPALQIGLTLGLINQRLDRAMNSLRFLDVVKEFLEGIGYQPGMTPEMLAPAFQRAEREFYTPLIEGHPWILENYLTHAVYRSMFPFGAGGTGGAGTGGAGTGGAGTGGAGARNKTPGNPEQEFRTLATHFVAIRTLLVGMAGFHGSAFATDHVVRLVQSYSRMVDHHAEFLSAVGGLMESRNLVDAGSLAGLLLEGAGRPPLVSGAMA